MRLLDGLLGHGSEADADKLAAKLKDVLLPGEQIAQGYKIIRDYFVFTNRRMIIVDVQGWTGRKINYLTIPYRAITSFSLETAGTFDLDADIKIWVSGQVAPITRTLRKGTDIGGIQRTLAQGVLG